jgi:uncharacterized coiled-coil protein SlyX
MKIVGSSMSADSRIAGRASSLRSRTGRVVARVKFTFLIQPAISNTPFPFNEADRRPYTVRYEAVNAMLLNEFLKEHRKGQEQDATIAQLKSAVAQQQKDFQATAAHQQKQIEALTAGLQTVSAQVEMSKPASQMVLNNQ